MNYKILALLFIINISNSADQIHNGITYRLSQGRFGDQIIAYAKAKYLAKKYSLRFLYRTFAYSNLLNLHQQQDNVDNFPRTYIKHLDILPITHIEKFSAISTLYVAQLDTKKDELSNLDSIYDLMLGDKKFSDEIQCMLQPVVDINTLELPKDCITVALHVRKGSGHDRSICSLQLYDTVTYLTKEKRNFDKTNLNKLRADERYPHKFPPDQFYIEALKLLSELVDDKPLYVYLFTDYRQPEELIALYKREINKENITFTCHTAEQQQKMRMIDDYYNITQFDCLIRSASNFSRASQLLGIDTIKVIIAAKHAQWYEDAVIIDSIQITARNGNKKTYKQCTYKITDNKNSLNTIKQYIQKLFS